MTFQFSLNSEVTIAYDLEGEGPGLVCLPGLGAGRESFKAVATLCADRRMVLRFDYRGIGDSIAHGEAAIHFTWRDLAEDVWLLVEHVAASHPAFLPCEVVGMSFGGVIAMLLAEAHPGAIAHCTLVSTSRAKTAYGVRINALIQRLMQRVSPEEFGEVMTTFAFTPEFIDAHPGLKSLNQTGIVAKAGSGAGFEGRYRPAAARMAELGGSVPESFAEPFSYPREQTTAIVGAEDLMVSPEGRASLLEIAGEAIELPHAGHIIAELPQLMRGRMG